MPEFAIIPGTNPEAFISFSETRAWLTMVKNDMRRVPGAAHIQQEPGGNRSKGLTA